MVDLKKPLTLCTLGEFVEAIMQVSRLEQEQPTPGTEMFKGIEGLQKIFHCGNYTARQILHSGAIDAAIIRTGARSFITDKERAIQLYKNYNNN